MQGNVCIALALILSAVVATQATFIRVEKCPKKQPEVKGCKEGQSGAELQKCVEALITHGKAAQLVMDDMLDSNCFGFKSLVIKKPMKDVEKDCTDCVKILGPGFIDAVLKKSIPRNLTPQIKRGLV